MTLLAEIVSASNAHVQPFASQDELDELGLMLDRLEELEIYFHAPSISDSERENTFFEMEALMERMDYYMEKV